MMDEVYRHYYHHPGAWKAPLALAASAATGMYIGWAVRSSSSAPTTGRGGNLPWTNSERMSELLKKEKEYLQMEGYNQRLKMQRDQARIELQEVRRLLETKGTAIDTLQSRLDNMREELDIAHRKLSSQAPGKKKGEAPEQPAAEKWESQLMPTFVTWFKTMYTLKQQAQEPPQRIHQNEQEEWSQTEARKLMDVMRPLVDKAYESESVRQIQLIGRVRAENERLQSTINEQEQALEDASKNLIAQDERMRETVGRAVSNTKNDLLAKTTAYFDRDNDMVAWKAKKNALYDKIRRDIVSIISGNSQIHPAPRAT